MARTFDTGYRCIGLKMEGFSGIGLLVEPEDIPVRLKFDTFQHV